MASKHSSSIAAVTAKVSGGGGKSGSQGSGRSSNTRTSGKQGSGRSSVSKMTPIDPRTMIKGSLPGAIGNEANAAADSQGKGKGVWQAVQDWFGAGEQAAPQEQESAKFSEEANSEAGAAQKPKSPIHNFLAEAVEQGIKDKNGGENTPAKSDKEQPKSTAASAAQAQEDADMDAGWAKLEQQSAENEAHKKNYEDYQKQIRDLQMEGQTKSQIWVDGIYMGEDKEVADAYAAQIKDLQEKAEKERKAAGIRDENILEGKHVTVGDNRVSDTIVGSVKGYGAEVGKWFGGHAEALDMLGKEYGEKLGTNTSDYAGWATDDMSASQIGHEYDPTLWDKDIEANQKLQADARALKESGDADIAAAKDGLGFVGSLAVDLGSNATQMAMDALLGPASMVGLGIRASGGGMLEAEANGADLMGQIKYGDTVGAVEGLTEKMFGGLAKVYGKAGADDLVESVVRKLAKTPAGQKVLLFGADMLGEGIEEIVSDKANPFAKALYDGGAALKEKYGSWKGFKNAIADELYDGLVGALMGAVGGGMKLGNGPGSYTETANRLQVANQAESTLLERGVGEKDASDLAAIIAKQATGEELSKKEKERLAGSETATALANEMAPAQPAEAAQAAPQEPAEVSNLRMFFDGGETAGEDAAAIGGLKANAASWLGAKIAGGETGGSILGEILNPETISQLPAGAQQAAQAFANTEGAEECTQNVMNYIADQVRGTEGWTDEQTNAATNYVLGTLSNFFRKGEEVDPKRQQNIAAEAVEFARSGMTLDQAIDAAQQSAQKAVTAKPKPAPVQTAQPAQDSTGTAWTGDWNSWVEAALSGGALSDTDVNTIYNRPEARQAFEKLKNISLDDMSEEEAKSYIGMAAGTMTKPVAQESAQKAESAEDESSSSELLNSLGMKPSEAAENDPVREWVNSRREAQKSAEDGLNSTESKDSKKAAEIDQNLDKLINQRLKEIAKNGKRKRGTVSFEGGELNGQKVEGVDPNNLTKQQRSAVKAAQAVADALGLDIVFFSDPAKDGNIKLGAWQGDKLYLNMDGAIRANKNGKTTSRFIVGATLSHELTHYLQKYDPEGYAQLRDFVESTILEKDSASMERMIKQQIAMDPSLTPEEALDEIVANACQEMLYDNDVVKQLARQNMTLFEKIVDIFDSVGNRIKGAFAEVDLNDSDIYRAARLMKGEEETLKKIWSRNLLTATENFQNQQAGENKNAAQTDDVKYQVYEGMSDEERTAELSDRELTVYESNVPEELKGDVAQIENLIGTARSKAEKAIIPIAQKIGILNREMKTPEVDVTFTFSKTGGLKESINKQGRYGGNYADFTKALINIDKILSTAIKVEEHSDKYKGTRRENPNLKNISVLLGAFRDGDNIIPVQFEIKNASDYGGRLYMTVALTKFKADVLERTSGENTSTFSLISANYSLPDIIEKINPVDSHFLKYLPDGLLSEAQIESKNKALQEDQKRIDGYKAKLQQFQDDSPVKSDIETLSKITDKDGKAQFQVAAFENDEPEYRSMLSRAGWKESDIDTLFEKVNKAVEVIKDNQEALDYAWDADIDDRAFNPVKQNSDKLYKVSQDFSTLCRKRILQGVIAGELSDALQRGLTKEEGIAVRDALMALQKEGKQIEVACALCYVESARMRSQKAIQEFLNNREASIRNYFAGKQGKEAESAAEAAERNAIYEELGMIRGKGDDDTMYDVRDAKTATMKVLPTNIKKRIQEAKKKARASYPLTDEQQRLVDEANKLPVTAFTTPEGLQELAKNKDTRDIFNAFVLKVSAASKSKGIENDTWWRAGDSKSISDLLIEQMNAENGLRTQSWSDFQVKHLMDYIAATIELSTRQAKQHAYTKVLDYVELMGDTGVMINMSLIPTADYNGKLEFDDVEGFKYKEAMRMRNKFPDTAGTICIGMDNDQIHQLLESDEIDYVIPYHQSGMSKATRAAMHIPAWKDFQSFQGEKKLSGDAAAENAAKYGVKLLDESDKKWHEGPAFSEWFDLEKARETAAKYGKSGKYGVMTGGYMAMQEAAENYKRICAERGLQPKFSYGKADFSEDANYWKLLIDRKMVNNKTGEIIEQKAIQPNFNMDTIQRILDDELERYGNVKADQEEAIQRVTEAVMSGKVKGGMSSEEIAKAMQKPIDNLAITAATQGQTYNPDIFDPVETLTEKPKQTGTKKTQTTSPTDTADILAETATGKTGKKGTKLNWNDRSSGKEKTSEYYSNTATKNGKAKELNETNFKYVPISEQKSIRRAATKVANNYDEVLADLYGNRTWLSEQVDAAWLISDKLHNEAVATGTKEAWDAYNKFEELIQDHATEAGAALQAFAKQSRPGSAAVMRAAQARINAIREARAEAEKSGKTKGLVSEEALKKAEEKTREYATQMGKLEYEIDQKIKGGMSEETARNEAKNAYLDLIDEINTFRHTGLIQDAGKQANNREAMKANKEVQKLNTKFRKMLEKEDMEYIMRFAATDMAGISADTQYDGKQDFRKRLNTWQKLAQLTGTGTWLRNGVGNGSFGIVDVLATDNPVTILADALLSAKTGKRSSGFETGILNKVARDAAAHSLRRSILEVAANIDIDGDSDTTKYDMGTTRTYDPDSEHLLTRIGSRWEQWNGYMLQSSDAWFKGMAKGSAEAAIRKANRWDKGNLTKAERASMTKDQAEKLSKKRQAEIDETVRQIAEYRTFQNDSMLSKGADKAREGLNKFGAGLLGRKWQQGQFGLGTALMPYTKVPTNLAMKAVEFSPAGALNGLREMVQVLNDPNATMAQQQKAVTDFGRGITGTALVALMASLMKQFKFFKDWDDEEDPDVKAQNRAEGKYGMQFNIDMIKRWAKGDKNPTWENGDRTLDISSMEPLNQLIGAASLLADDEELTAKGVLTAFTHAAHDSLNNMPALQTLANIENTIRYTDTPDDIWQTLVTTASSTAGNVAGGMIPAPIKHYAALTDENVRDTSGKNAAERAKNQIKSAIPGLRETLPVKRDAFGNEMKAGDFATRFANQYDSFKHTQVNQSGVSRELERLRNETGVSRMPSRNGPSSITFGSGKDKETVKLKGQERVDYKNAEGTVTNMTLEELFGLPAYKNADSDTQDAMVAELESYAKDTTKGLYAEHNGLTHESSFAAANEAKDPVAFLTAKTGFNLAKGDNDWDAVDTLLKTVRDGRLSEAEQEVYEEHMPGFKKLYAMSGRGISSKRVTDFADALKEHYEGEKRTDARGSDFIRVACSGKFSNREADIFMSYAPDVSQKTINGYKEQVQYQLKQAGKSGAYDVVWDGIERVVNGELDKASYNSWVDKNIPLKYRKELKNICSNYAKDRTESGKTVSGIYKAMRDSGYTAKQALEFYEMIDTNYNGYYTKKEFDAACAKAFGKNWRNTKYGKQVRSLLKEYVGK